MPVRLPCNPNLQHLRKLAKHLVNDHRAGELAAGERIRQYHSRFAGATPKEVLAADFSLQDAQLIIAVESGQRNWSRLVALVELMRQVHQAFISGDSVHVIAKDAEQIYSFEALLQPHYSTDQLGVLSPFMPGENAQAALSRSIRVLAKTPILLSEYRTLGLSHLIEHQHKPKGPFRVDRGLARTHAIMPRSVLNRRTVVLGSRKAVGDGSGFDSVLKLNPRQLSGLYRSTSTVDW